MGLEYGFLELKDILSKNGACFFLDVFGLGSKYFFLVRSCYECPVVLTLMVYENDLVSKSEGN